MKESFEAIPTVYEGVRYRSRLEARWAAFFDQIGWRHTYEPFDANGYIPDFAIYGSEPLLVEVKPAVAEEDYWSHLEKIIPGLAGHWRHSVLVVGVSPLDLRIVIPGLPRVIDGVEAPEDLLSGIFEDTDLGPAAGILAPPPSEGGSREFGYAWWHRSRGRITLRGLTWIPAVHGTTFGTPERLSDPVADQVSAGGAVGDLNYDEVKNYWAAASNAVQWRGRDAD